MQIHEAATKSAIKKGSNDIFVDPSKHSIKMQNCYIHGESDQSKFHARSAKIHSGDIHNYGAKMRVGSV